MFIKTNFMAVGGPHHHDDDAKTNQGEADEQQTLSSQPAPRKNLHAPLFAIQMMNHANELKRERERDS